jgi:hypothetical protein
VTRKPSGPTGQMLKGPAGTHWTEKGPSREFYDELQASQMNNCRSHKYTSDGEGSHRYTSVEKGPTGAVAWRKDRAETFMTNCKHHG